MSIYCPRAARVLPPLAPQHWALGLLLGFVLLGSGQAQGLLEVYQAARAFDATYLSARAQFEANRAKAAQALGGLLPQVSLSAKANWAEQGDSLRTGKTDSRNQSVALSASQPLYRPANKLSHEQAQLGLDLAQAQLHAAEQDLILRVSQAYFDVLAAQDSLAFVGAQKSAVAQQLQAAKRNFEVGTATVTDSREAQARFDLVLAQELAADNELKVKKLALDQLCGQTDVNPKPLTVPLSLPRLEPSALNAWVDAALTQHPLVRQAAKNADIAQLEMRKAKAAHMPTLDLLAQHQITRTPPGTYANALRTEATSLGLQLTLPLYAGGVLTNRVKETLALQDKAQADLDAARRNVTQATRAAYFGVLSGQAQVKALQTAELSSQSALDANKLGYQVGVRINIDVLNAQSQLFQTKRDLALAHYGALLGSLRLKQASGQLAEQDIERMQGLLER